MVQPAWGVSSVDRIQSSAVTMTVARDPRYMGKTPSSA
jgi:hypothetical protein